MGNYIAKLFHRLERLHTGLNNGNLIIRLLQNNAVALEQELDLHKHCFNNFLNNCPNNNCTYSYNYTNNYVVYVVHVVHVVHIWYMCYMCVT